MNTTTGQQAITIPAGFTTTIRREDDDQDYPHHNGPSTGGVASYWAPDQGIVLTVNGYGDEHHGCKTLGFDVTPDQARTLSRDLADVVAALDLLPTPEVERVAPKLHDMGPNATVEDIVRLSIENHVKPSAVLATYQAVQI